MPNKSLAQVLELLRRAPNDTTRRLAEFLQKEICEPTHQSLGTISDKTLARHLNAKINGPTRRGLTSPRANKVVQNSPLRPHVMMWGLGSANRAGEWRRAVNAVECFMLARSITEPWSFGRTLTCLNNMLEEESPRNNDLTALVEWLLDGEISFDLKERLHFRLVRSLQHSALEHVEEFKRDWFRKPWSDLGIDRQLLIEHALPLCEDNRDKAETMAKMLL